MQNNGDDKDKLPNNLPDKPSDKAPVDAAPKKKKSWWYRAWRAWCDWWVLTYESYVVEVQDRILMSWKRIIKFCGIAIIPILYGVICSVAMWNPVEELGNATFYVMDDDYSVLLVSDTDNQSGQFDYGAVKYFNNENEEDQDAIRSVLTGLNPDGTQKDGFSKTGLTSNDIVFDPDQKAIGIKNSAIKNDVERQKMSALIFANALYDDDGGNSDSAVFYLADGNDGNTGVDYNADDAGFQFQITSTWDLIKGALLPKTDSAAADTDYRFKAPKLLTHPAVALTNIHYSSDKEFNNKYYQKRKGWIQAKIPEWYTAKAINYISLTLRESKLKAAMDPTNPNPDDAKELANLQDQLWHLTNSMQPLGLWTTYERNFLFGYMFDMMSGLLGSQIIATLPQTLNTAAVANISQYLSTDAATVAQLTGGLKSINDKPIVIVNNKDHMDMGQRYVITSSSSFDNTTDPERFKSASLFGDTSASLRTDVGGKFINTIETAISFVGNGGLSGLLSKLGIPDITSGLQDIAKELQNLINSIIKALNGDKTNASWDADGKPKNSISYTLNGVSFKNVPKAEDLANEFKLVKDGSPDEKVNATYKFNPDTKNPNSGSVDITINNVKQSSTDQTMTYLLTSNIDPTTGNNNMSWTQPIICKVPKGSTPDATDNSAIVISDASTKDGTNIVLNTKDPLVKDVTKDDFTIKNGDTALDIASVEGKATTNVINITLANTIQKTDKVEITTKGFANTDPIVVATDGMPDATNPNKKEFTNFTAKNSVINFKSQSDQDEALVLINKAVYNIAIGHPGKGLTDAEKVTINAAIAAAWKALKLQGTAPTLESIMATLKGTNVLQAPDGKPYDIMSETLFDKNMDNFIAANKDTKTTDGKLIFGGATKVDDVLPKLIADKANDDLFGLKTSKLVTYKIQGAEFGYEGIGIGLFFLTVGLYVGAMLHSFIFDRAKRLTKSRWSNWYFSKLMLMLTVGFFQVTAEVWIVYAAGWSAIGATAMCYVWLWLLMSDTMFIVIIQALWFSLKDEIIGKFLMVIVLVTSIAAGGGEFPAWSEFGFFNAISYVVPFTYVINGFDTITFAISLNGTTAETTSFMFQQFGIELLYIAIFLTFGMLVGAQLRMKEMNYGSHYGFAVAGAMRALGKDTSEFQVLRKVTRKGKKRYYYNWKALPDAFVPELYFQCRKMYKFAGEFKWWQRKHHDFVQKPNYSDEEIVSRNE